MKAKNLLELLTYSKSHDLIKEPMHGGNDDTIKREPKEGHLVKNVDVLSVSLQKVIDQNNKWLLAIYVILICLIVFLSIILWIKMDDQKFFFAVLSGQGLSVLVCINRLSYLYKQKRATEILLHLYRSSKSKAERDKLVDEIIIFLKGKTS